MAGRFVWIALLLVTAACAADKDNGGGNLAVQGPIGVAGMAAAGTGVTPQTPIGTAGTAAPGTGGSVSTPTGPVAGSDGMTAAGAGGAGGGGAPPGNCQGFSFDGLVYSPGGDALPNSCEPFHPTTNNPYAVRCIDAWPWYRTIYPGDEYCILPPPPDKGIQVGVHPQGKEWFAQVSTGDMSGYENLPDAFVMEPGEEEEANYHTSASNTQEQNFYRNYARMRGGSHHMINSTAAAGGQEEVWGPGSPDGLFGGTSIPGAQRPDENGPKTLEKPTEDAGLYSVLQANPGVTFNMHHFNATDRTILKEAWLNLWWESDARIRSYGIMGLDLVQVATLNVPAGATQNLHYSWTIAEPIRLVTLFGHRHAWTTNFTSWIEAPGKELEILYQSFNWLDEPTYRYDSITDNPVPAPQSLTDGASSGLRMLNPGEKLHFNCHIEFTEERAATEMAPSPGSIGSLRFANQAFDAEMCILFGSTAAVRLPAPAADSSALPDFATID